MNEDLGPFDFHEIPDPMDSDKTPVLLHPLRRAELFKAGQDLFNEEKFFEAHEEWEKLWRFEQGRDRTFVQGLIQVAGHFVHMQKENWSGAIRLAEKAKEKLILPPADRHYRQVDTLPIVSALNYNVIEVENTIANLSAEQKAALRPKTDLENIDISKFLIPKIF